MAKIRVEVQAEDHGHGSYDSEETITVKFQESERYVDSVEINVDGRYIHIDKDELKKAVTLLCD